ncbi:hypothetical protein Rvan_2058 [Rhodomicrobium vannielii ATCC 17100]|uniref:Polymerase nucleotidyl transferase domain-containing protein n=1 Tax=Rhodomicrobium vannielii (strain ATCC 17100 / DSM 162 / LMG 4299 / NCIMB 10020 / ATH 3.1.1) TaxID=648757 RepID=E3I1Y5_RHOVT|nr:GrpB family protein [Rhodomicrobium vannielii]ADP71286.1 hypothetical protein Rvan_2058 [Rhodomicrobium vannielii ATCC 17100]
MARHDLFGLALDADAARRAAEALFETVKRELDSVLPTCAEALHIGATSIPGCLTKGDLDIVVRVERADFSGVKRCFSTLFSPNVGSTCTDDFAAFEDDRRTPHLGIQLTAKVAAKDVFVGRILRARPSSVRPSK